MKISCIIPTCDRNELLIEAIESILNQTITPLEIIIVNNGKREINLLEDLKMKVKIFNIIPYAGASQARNFGASMAEGDYLAFLDDDDLWNSNYLENVNKAIKQGAECIVSRLDKITNGKVLPFKNASNRLNIDNILIQNPGITGSNLVLSKKLFLKVGGFDPLLPPSEDKALILELLKIKKVVHSLSDNQAIIRMHGDKRLSDSARMAEGIYQFTRKYQNLMNLRQFLFNWLKIFHFRHKSGEKIAIFYYFFIKIFYYFILIIYLIRNKFNKYERSKNIF